MASVHDVAAKGGKTRDVGDAIVVEAAADDSSAVDREAVAPMVGSPDHAQVITALALLAAPLLLLWPLHAVLFNVPDMIDPFLHTAVIEHGRDLLQRFGTDDRQFTRVRFTVPGGDDLSPVRGRWRVLRPPLFLRPASRLRPRTCCSAGCTHAAGAIAVAALLTNPVIVKAWSTDFPTSSAVSYLVGAYCCLVMPAGRRLARFGWLAASGALLGLALYSHVITALLVGCVLFVYAVSRVRGGIVPLLHEAGVLTVAFLGTSVVLSAGAKVFFGAADIWTPNWRALSMVRSEEQTAVFHSTNWRWVIDTPSTSLCRCWPGSCGSSSRCARSTDSAPRNGCSGGRSCCSARPSSSPSSSNVSGRSSSTTTRSSSGGPQRWFAISVLCELSRALLDAPRWCWAPAVSVLLLPLVITAITRHASMSLFGAALFVVATRASCSS